MPHRHRLRGNVDRVKLGVFGLNSKATSGSAPTARLAKRGEELGFDSLWVGEHVVLPSPRVPPAPMEPTEAILDPLVHLAFVAGVTERMLLGTGIIIVPQRNPLVLAKQVASLDTLCGGRFLLGIGVGYLEAELNALGVSLAERASRTDDYLGAMRAMWYAAAPVSFSGRHTQFSGIDAHPRPAGRIPIVVGGHTVGAFKRTVEQGDAWFGFFPRSRASRALCRGTAGWPVTVRTAGRTRGVGDQRHSTRSGNGGLAACVRRYRASIG